MKKSYAVLAALLMVPNLFAAEAKINFMAGASKVKITPVVEPFSDANNNHRYDDGEPFKDYNRNGKWDPVWLAGYQGGRYATGVHDDLWTTALALSDGTEPMLIITVDLIGYLFDDVAAVKARIKKELGVSPSRIFICSTHDHSAPDAIGLWGQDGKTGKDEEFLSHVRGHVFDCAKDALSRLKPARAVFGKIRYDNPIEDSRPPKVINDMLLTMQFVDEENRAIATLANYAMHAEVLNGGNTEITSDYPGVLRERIEKKYGGVGMFVAADIGGMQSPFVLFHSFWSRGRVGKGVAEKVIESLSDKKPVEIKTLKVSSRDILFPVNNKRYVGAIESGMFGSSREYIHKDADGYHLPADIGFIQIGPAQILTLPGEAFPELGNVLRRKMAPGYPFVFGLCNNEIGYIVPDSEWHDDGYEENMSLGRQTADMITAAVSDLISKL